jgi:hypothetical protein
VEVSNLRDSVEQIKTVLTSKKTGQTDIKKLWLQKAELEESLRMLNSLELLKVPLHRPLYLTCFSYPQDAPLRVQHLTNQNRYLAAVNTLNSSVENMFNMVPSPSLPLLSSFPLSSHPLLSSGLRGGRGSLFSQRTADGSQRETVRAIS